MSLTGTMHVYGLMGINDSGLFAWMSLTGTMHVYGLMTLVCLPG